MQNKEKGFSLGKPGLLQAMGLLELLGKEGGTLFKGNIWQCTRSCYYRFLCNYSLDLHSGFGLVSSSHSCCQPVELGVQINAQSNAATGCMGLANEEATPALVYAQNYLEIQSHRQKPSFYTAETQS